MFFVRQGCGDTPHFLARARDVLRPDTIVSPAARSEVQGARLLARDRSHPDPRAAPLGASMGRMARTYPLARNEHGGTSFLLVGESPSNQPL